MSPWEARRGPVQARPGRPREPRTPPAREPRQKAAEPPTPDRGRSRLPARTPPSALRPPLHSLLDPVRVLSRNPCDHQRGPPEPTMTQPFAYDAVEYPTAALPQ